MRRDEMAKCPCCGQMGIRVGLMGGACTACGKTERDFALEEKQQKKGKRPVRPVRLEGQEEPKCLVCNTTEGVERRLCVARDHTGWFAFEQHVCSSCYEGHLHSLPHYMPFRKGAIHWMGPVSRQ